MSLWDKLVINAAITGMVPMKSDTPHVPITVEEIVADIARVRDAGASIVHLHARRPDGTADYRASVYREILAGAREVAPDIILCVSTSGRVFGSFEQRSEVLGCTDPDPEMASLTLGSMNFPRTASVNSPEMIHALAGRMAERGIVPEWECFDRGMVDYSHYLVERGVLKPPFYCNLLLGSLGTLSATPANLAAMAAGLPAGTTWAAAGIGRYQLPMNALAITMGGHVRVGLEDNIWYDHDRTTLATNASLIERLVGIAHACGREIASPDEARRLIGLPARRPARTEPAAPGPGRSPTAAG